MSVQNSETKLTIVRHGHVHNPEGVLYGRLPRFTLSEEGFRQAEAAAQTMQDWPIAALFSSPLLRARKTAEKILTYHPHLTLRLSKHLIEVHTPFEGQPLVELEKTGWDFYTHVPQGFETPDDIITRTLTFIDIVKRDYTGEHVVAVAHGDIVGFATIWARGLPITGQSKRQYFTQTEGVEYPATASLTTFTFHPDRERPTYSYLRPYERS